MPLLFPLPLFFAHAFTLAPFSFSAAAQETESRDSVIIAVGSEPETLDPVLGWGRGSSPIIQSTLIRYTEDLSFENDLAVSYSLSEDGLTWSFTIRDNARFTDGEPLTAEDVAFTLNKARESMSSADLTCIESGPRHRSGKQSSHRPQKEIPACLLSRTINISPGGSPIASSLCRLKSRPMPDAV